MRSRSVSKVHWCGEEQRCEEERSAALGTSGRRPSHEACGPIVARQRSSNKSQSLWQSKQRARMSATLPRSSKSGKAQPKLTASSKESCKVTRFHTGGAFAHSATLSCSAPAPLTAAAAAAAPPPPAPQAAAQHCPFHAALQAQKKKTQMSGTNMQHQLSGKSAQELAVRGDHVSVAAGAGCAPGAPCPLPAPSLPCCSALLSLCPHGLAARASRILLPPRSTFSPAPLVPRRSRGAGRWRRSCARCPPTGGTTSRWPSATWGRRWAACLEEARSRGGG